MEISFSFFLFALFNATIRKKGGIEETFKAIVECIMHDAVLPDATHINDT